jgi:methylmalonyl-CoA/ethylmalonyl-CoA epimerase
MYGKIHHIGIAVKSLLHTIQFYRDVIGIEYEKELDWSQLGLKAALFNLGETKLEFIEPVNPEGDLAKSILEFAQLKDGMVHHMALAVDDVAAEVNRLKSMGVKMLTEEPVKSEGGTVAWLDMKTVDGLLIELCDMNYKVC